MGLSESMEKAGGRTIAEISIMRAAFERISIASERTSDLVQCKVSPEQLESGLATVRAVSKSLIAEVDQALQAKASVAHVDEALGNIHSSLGQMKRQADFQLARLQERLQVVELDAVGSDKRMTGGIR